MSGSQKVDYVVTSILSVIGGVPLMLALGAAVGTRAMQIPNVALINETANSLAVTLPDIVPFLAIPAAAVLTAAYAKVKGLYGEVPKWALKIEDPKSLSNKTSKRHLNRQPSKDLVSQKQVTSGHESDTRTFEKLETVNEVGSAVKRYAGSKYQDSPLGGRTWNLRREPEGQHEIQGVPETPKPERPRAGASQPSPSRLDIV